MGLRPPAITTQFISLRLQIRTSWLACSITNRLSQLGYAKLRAVCYDRKAAAEACDETRHLEANQDYS